MNISLNTSMAKKGSTCMTQPVYLTTKTFGLDETKIGLKI